MSGHDPHDASTDGAHAEKAHAPGLPTVHDEAADTPMWVPILGATFLVLAGGWLLYKVATFSSDAAAEAAAMTDGSVADGEVTGDGGTPAPDPAPAPSPQ